MAMTAFHRFTRRLLWRTAGLGAVMLVAAWMFGATSVWRVVEWIPMTLAIILVVVHVASFIRQRG
jgi:hypothetical protein